MSTDALIFDFDGLLMDTETTLLRSWEYEWQQWGLVLDRSTFFADHGGDVSDQRYAQLAAAVGDSYDRAASHARRVAYRDGMHHRLDLAPGIRDWITEAGTLGIRLAVASSSPRPWVHNHLARVGVLGQIAVLATGDEVSRHKPDPAVYDLALQRLAVPPTRAIAVEDTPHGVTAAQAACLACAAIPNPYVDPSTVTHADAVLPTASSTRLTDLIHRINGSRWASKQRRT